MVRRWTAIGALLLEDQVAGKKQIEATINECGGNVRRTAFLLDVGQPWLCRLIVRLSLQDVVAEARKRASRPDWLIETRRVLAMDEQLQAIVNACAGKSEDEILQMIMSSSNADSFQDPGLVAAYIASLAGGAA